MSPKLPQVSGQELVRFIEKLGYHVIRQKGSHIRLRKTTSVGEHNITVPNHKVVAKGTLNDIITKVSLWNNISKDDLIKMI
ncbi:MAG: type II toxin-antitoxin system HicA family toxin [Nitrospirae bacterium]|nr:type II toxin-antitoxin system HicA family toxin [Nitrospirota bacterium]